jgi:elongation factor P--beta-lysine ligase
VTESHKVLDNSFLSSQVHLTNHISDLNYQACLDIVTAMSTYTDFITVTREMVEAEEVSFREIFKNWNELNLMSDELFCQLDKEAVLRMARQSEDKDDDVIDEFRNAYDDLTIFELFDNM